APARVSIRRRGGSTLMATARETNWYAYAFITQRGESIGAERTATRKTIILYELHRVSREHFVRGHASRVRFRIGTSQSKSSPSKLCHDPSTICHDFMENKAKLVIRLDIRGLCEDFGLFSPRNFPNVSC